MNESEFHERVDAIIEQIEDALDDCDADIDYEGAGGILTLEFADGGKIIINRQTPIRQIWVATRQGGFHFNYLSERDGWYGEGDDAEFFAVLSRYCSEQAGEPVQIKPE